MGFNSWFKGLIQWVEVSWVLNAAALYSYRQMSKTVKHRINILYPANAFTELYGLGVVVL